MYISGISLQFDLLMKAQTIFSGLREHSQIQILMLVNLIVFSCNIGHRPPAIMSMLKHMRDKTPAMVTFGIRIGGLIWFGPTQIILWMHGNRI